MFGDVELWHGRAPHRSSVLLLLIAGAAGMGWFGLGRHPPDGEDSSGAPTTPGNGDSRPGEAAEVCNPCLNLSANRPEDAGDSSPVLL